MDQPITLSRLVRAGLAMSLAGTALITASVAISAGPEADTAAIRVARLTRDVESAESVRAVKHLQTAYAQYSQSGLWTEMASLFSDNAELIYGGDTVQGRAAVGRYFLEKFGGGYDGLPPGAVHTQMIVRPVVTLGADRVTAKGRFTQFSMSGRPGGSADWAGGIQENEYVKERGVWKIARLHYYAQYGGSYEQGWLTLEPDTKIVPYHFTADNIGTPIPPARDSGLPVLADNASQRSARLAALDARLDAMVAEDQVKNLQNIYGYYLDRKMWDDVADLFTSDGVLAIANVGVYEGAKSIRRGLDRDGPAGLQTGQLNDHVLFDTVVEVAPGGTEARARGLDLTMLGETAKGTASLGVSVFQSRFVKSGGIWRIREVRVYPAAKTDYAQGWAKSALIDPPPPARFAPDRPMPAADVASTRPAVVDFFYPNPVTTQAPIYPRETQVLGKIAAPRSSPRAAAKPSPASGVDARLADAERKLRMATAYDGVENISSGFGDWLDDFQWESASALFAEQGRRRKNLVGFYVGPAHILKAETLMYGAPRSPRLGVAIHYRIQPVIDVAADGRSAKLRTRLFHITVNRTRPGVLKSGNYPNDAAVLEKGAWRFSNMSIDESYFESLNYKDGWAHAKEPVPVAPGAPVRAPDTITKLIAAFPPDVPQSAMPKRLKGLTPADQIVWPAIKPMWFHYVNPVSGRVPEYYCPDEFTCEGTLTNRTSDRD
jgi:hypothetical protein